MATKQSERTKKENLAPRLWQELAVPALATDARGRVTFWSAPLETLTGVAKGDILGRVAWKGFARNQKKRQETPVEQALKTGQKVVTEEFPVLHRQSGATTLVSFVCSPVVDEEGEVQGATATLLETQAGAFLKQAELDDALQKVEYLNRMPVLMAALDPEGRIIFINGVALQGGDKTLEDLVGKCLWELDDLQDQKETSATMAALVRDAVATGRPGEAEYDLNLHHGGLLPVKANALPQLDEEGNVSSVLLVSTPIPEQRRAIDTANERLEYLNKMPLLMAVLDTEGRIKFINDMALRAGNLKMEDMIGTFIWDLGDLRSSPESKNIVIELLKNTVATSQPGEAEYEIQTPHGLLPLKANALPLLDEQGNVDSVLLANTPIPEQRRAINEANERLNYLNKMPLLMAVLDTEGRIIFVNDTALQGGDETLEGLTGQCLWELDDFKDHPETRATMASLVRNAVATGQPGEAEYDIDLQGGILPVKSNALPLLDEDGRVRSVLMASTPIPEQRRALRKVERILDYQKAQAERLVRNMAALADGTMEFDLTVDESDDDTAKVAETFGQISTNLGAAGETVSTLLDETAKLIDAVRGGDLVFRGNANAYQGRWRQLIEGINAVVQPFHDAVLQVADAAGQVSSASSQIAEGAQSISQGASEQASAIEQTSSNLEEMASMTDQNAVSARKANELTQGMSKTAEKSRDAMTRMIESMKSIRVASESTSQIIRDINEIAFQTNLLALNAAVEAARAGDAGRGFAVVAEEVRNLAGRSKEAAGKTEALINESMRLSNEGERISGEVGAKLSDIVENVLQATGLAEEIAASSNEQARGIEQLNQAVVQMEQVVQQNASSAEEASSASEELASQAEQLSAMVSSFRLNRRAPNFQRKRRMHSTISRPPKARATYRSLRSGEFEDF